LLASKKLEDKIEYKRNTALTTRDARRRHMGQPKVYKILKQVSQDIKKQQKFKET
jgi:murein endopeptidase